MTEYFKPISNNALMNFSLIDYTENKNRPEASKYNKEIKKEINKYLFNKDQKKNFNDKMNRNYFERQFYINPNTQIINKQKELGMWLYGNSGKCRDYPEECSKNISNNYHFRYDKHY